MDELADLVKRFLADTGYPEGGRPEREAERAQLAAALTPGALKQPDVEALRRLGANAYGLPGQQPAYFGLLRREDGVTRWVETLRFLLHGPGDVVERLDDCLNGGHRVPGMAEAILIKALAVTDPQRWVPNYVTKGPAGKLALLAAIGDDFLRPAGQAEAAVASNDRIRELFEPHFPGDPWGIQEFCWWLRAESGPASPLSALADELYLPERFLQRILRLLDDKGQTVFYGPPGTGKTFVARRLAEHIAGGGMVEMVQFHPSYAYEDFVEGYRPRLVKGQVTYEVVDGPLKRIATHARAHPDFTHVLLIDELNRGNIAKILGELLFLLEYRDEKIQLQYSEEPFALPPNLKILATMNTADRSVALVDAALRRRFHFVAFFPDTAPIDRLLRLWLSDHQPELTWVADVVDRANAALADRNLAIGPSHFLKAGLTEELVELAWQYSVLPFLEEHFFGDPDRLEEFSLDHLRHLPPAGEPDTGDELEL